MISLKRNFFWLSIIIIVCIIGFISVREEESTAVSASVKNHPDIIIDAGHGGFDGGAVANDGTVEKDINLRIASQLSEFLKIGGYNTILTRTSDMSTDNVESSSVSTRKKSDMQNRLELMQSYPDAIFVSIHLNKFTTSSAKGAQVFYSPKIDDARTLGDYIQTSVIERLQPDNKRVIKKGTKSTYLLYHAEIPAVIVECGFLSNSSELKQLKDEKYQNKMAFAIYCGILQYYSE